MINIPTLPPKAGYVEVEINGTRQYQPTPETLKQIEQTELQNETDSFLVDLSYRTTLLELGLEE